MGESKTSYLIQIKINQDALASFKAQVQDLKCMGCSFHLQNHDREPKFRPCVNQRPMTISISRSRQRAKSQNKGISKTSEHVQIKMKIMKIVFIFCEYSFYPLPPTETVKIVSILQDSDDSFYPQRHCYEVKIVFTLQCYAVKIIVILQDSKDNFYLLTAS